MTEDKRTEFAMAAVDFAGLFNTYFGEDNLAGWGVSLTAPEGQSTGGGVQALQHVTLTNPAEGKSIVIGGTNNVEKKAEVRTFDTVADQFQQRFGGPFPVDRAQYDGFLAKATGFFQNQGMQVVVTQVKAAAAAPAQKSGSTGLIVGIIVAVLALAAVLVYFLAFHES